MSPQLPRMMIFVPLDRATATKINNDGRTDDDLAGYAATRELIAAHDYRSDEREDADYAAQLYASVAGLADTADDRRLVIAADVPIARVSDSDADRQYGAVNVQGLEWKDVAAVFIDEEAASEAVGKAKAAIAAAPDRRLETIIDLPEVNALTDDHELLWHHPDEAW